MSKNESKQAFDPTTGPVLMVDREGRLLRANSAFYRVTGLAPQSADPLHLTELMHPDGQSASCEMCAGHLHVSSLAANEGDDGFSPDLIQTWLHDLHTAQGDWLCTAQVIRDSTVFSRPEAEAGTGAALLRHFVEAAYDAVYAATLEGRLLSANDRAAEILGLESEIREGE